MCLQSALLILGLFVPAWLNSGAKIPAERRTQRFPLKADISGSEPEGWCQLGLKNLFGIQCQHSPVSRMWCSSEYEPFYVWQKSISLEDSKHRLMKPQEKDIGGQFDDLQMFKFCSLLFFPVTFWTYKVPVCTFLWYLMVRKHIVHNVYVNPCVILCHLIPCLSETGCETRVKFIKSQKPILPINSHISCRQLW